MTKSISSYISKLLLIPVLGINIAAYASTEQTDNVHTNVVYPNINKGTVFNLTNSSDHRILFYTGEKDNAAVTGYFRASHFLGWKEYKFAPFEYYNKYGKKTLLDVASGPARNTVTLSNIEGLGQLISWSADGKSWVSQKINITDKFFNKLEKTNVHGINGVAAYGTNHTSLLTSTSEQLWQLWGSPNACYTEQNCTIENKYFGGQSNQFFLLQTRTLSSLKTNKLYTTSNLTDWYHVDVPFAQDTIQQVFNDASNNAVFASIIDSDNHRTLWVSHNLSEWASFNLPENSTVADAKVYKNHQIALLLVKNAAVEHDAADCSCACGTEGACICATDCACNNQLKTDLALLDPETKALSVLQTFEGKVTGLSLFDDKLYLTGNFVNKENKEHAALASMNL
jgi:hypothetical protein